MPRGVRCVFVADAGQIYFFLNYAREHWVQEGENPSVELIICSVKEDSHARGVLERLPKKVMAAEYHISLPD